MNEKRIIIKFVSTFIHSNYSRELVFYYLTEIEENTHPIWNDWDGIDYVDRIEIHNYDDDVLPDGLSVFKVISKIFKGAISVIERSGSDFFYFRA